MERYVIRGGEEGYQRLGVLARSWEPTTMAVLARAGLEPGMRCLDLGCGSGHVTRAIAGRVGPDGRVVGVDMDTVKLELAAAEAHEQGIDNVEFRSLNVYEWSEPATYDVVYSRFLLQHLRDPIPVLKSMWEGVRPGGVLVVEDADFEGSFCDPPHAGFDFWVEKYQRVLERHGGDPIFGRTLPRRLREAGLPAPATTVVQGVNVDGEAKSMPYLTVLFTAEAIVEEGLASRDELDAALEDLRQGAEDASQVWGTPRIFQCWVRKNS